MESAQRAVVVGGGVAGLTAAHELKERGYAVTVYEREVSCGGKAWSFHVPRSGNIRGLPAEHGFRFFPSFYRHLPRTMRHIPCGLGKCVFHNLVNIEHAVFAQKDKPFFNFPTAGPRSPGDWLRALREMFINQNLGLGLGEATFAAVKLFNAMSMCDDRREAELDGLAWWDYMGADDMSDAYRTVVVNGLTRNFVAMNAKKSSTKSVVNILSRLLNDFITSGSTMDRILNGPTSEVWIDPWVQYLKSDVGGPAVKFHCKTPVKSLVFDPASDRIIGVILGNSAAPVSDSEAFYVAAVPVEAMIDILANTPEILEHSPSLKLLPKLQVSWMSGLVCYLRKRDVPMCPGHVVYLNSNWALTSISQNQFWEKKIDQYGKPDIKGVISVIISDWFEPGNHSGRPACEAEHHADVERETFLEIQDHIKAAAGVDLDEKNIAGWFVDPALIFHKHLLGLMPAGEFVERRKRPSPSSADLNVVLVDKNKDPLFINTVGSWPWRPTERTGIANLFLASDYIKTNTDLATMEGANEAARRAVNGVLDAAQSTCRRCEIFEFDEPAPLAPFKAIDKRLFDLGLPHPSTFGDPLAYLGATATRQRRERGAR